MAEKPTTKELEKRIADLEQELLECRKADKLPRPRNERRFEILADSLPQTVFETDENGNLTFANRNAFETFGYIETDFHSGLSAIRMVHPKDRPRAVANMAKSMAGEDLGGVEYTAISKNGRMFPVMVHSSAIFSGNKPAGLRGIIIDLTNLKKVEEALKAQRERAQMYLDIAGVMFVAIDKNGIVTLINKRGCEILGYDEGEIIGKSWFDSFLAGDTRVDVEGVFRQLMKGALETVEYFENSILTKNGVARTIAWHNTLLKDERGNILGTFSSGVDITDQRLAEEEKKRLESQLAQSQKMEAIGTLAGGVAHDFNNILGIILGNIELAMLDVHQLHPVQQNLEAVRKACLRAKDLVKQILAFSRQKESERVPVKLGEIVKESLGLIRPSIPSTVEIRQEISDCSDTILVDPTQVHQVLLNICTNAAYAMRKEGGVLEIKLVDADPEDNALSPHPVSSRGEYVKLIIKDTGCGMDQEIIDRIFDPYFTTKEIGEGTGMGLAVANGIIANHDGTISVWSKPDEGSTFEVMLPVVECEIPEKDDEDDSMPTGNERILFIDDELSIVQVGKQILERLGYDVVTLTSSVHALELFRAQPGEFDLVITDMTMPRMTGDIIASEMIAIRPDIPIILCTGYSDRISDRGALKMGIREFVMKPLVMKDLAVSVRRVLDRK